MSRRKPDPPPEPFHSPFAGLGVLRDALPPFAPASPRARAERSAPPRAVVRLERKGRGGKEVTVVEQLALPRGELEAWLADLRRALGCGGAEEDGALVLQGDHRRRVEEWLRARGVRRVSVG
ncbi:MAG TPA: translation initiation factor [Myxococcaceae bacterium]|nr:translation initiation factor [Myxococcaceae bacterium]